MGQLSVSNEVLRDRNWGVRFEVNKAVKIYPRGQYIAIVANHCRFGVQGFIVPSGLGGGGVGGISLLLYYTLKLPIGLMTLILNIPLFVLGWREVNKKFVFKTIWGLRNFFTIFWIYLKDSADSH